MNDDSPMNDDTTVYLLYGSDRHGWRPVGVMSYAAAKACVERSTAPHKLRIVEVQ